MTYKSRAVLAGTEGEYIYPCPLDDRLMEFAAAIKANPSDEAAAKWFKQTANAHPPAKLEAWNRMMLSRGPSTPEKQEYFNKLRDAVAPPDRPHELSRPTRPGRRSDGTETIVTYAGTFRVLRNILTIAVQELLYAEANLKTKQLVLCESLPAAFESTDAATDPVIAVILGTEPVLEFMVMRVRKDWRLLTFDTGKPLFLARGQYATVMAEESYRLRWFVNNVLFKLDESGKLAAIRQRWLEESYAFPLRAAAEDLRSDVEKMVAQNDQGKCSVEPAR